MSSPSVQRDHRYDASVQRERKDSDTESHPTSDSYDCWWWKQYHKHDRHQPRQRRWWGIAHDGSHHICDRASPCVDSWPAVSNTADDEPVHPTRLSPDDDLWGSQNLQ